MAIAITCKLSTKLVAAQEIISAEEFYNGIQNNTFTNYIDIRTQAEWDAGHVPNATFVENLASQDSIPDELLACNNTCEILVVYCNSGARASEAIELLIDNNFKGYLLNAQGIQQWLEAGYELFLSESVPLSCNNDCDEVEVNDDDFDVGNNTDNGNATYSGDSTSEDMSQSNDTGLQSSASEDVMPSMFPQQSSVSEDIMPSMSPQQSSASQVPSIEAGKFLLVITTTVSSMLLLFHKLT